MAGVAEKRAAFRELHRSGCFVIPNPWDVGSARYLQTLGFKALATTSAGYCWSRGIADGGVDRAAMLAHAGELAAAVDLPLNVDYENGYAHQPEQVAESVSQCLQTGIAGLSIEDFTGDRAAPIYDFDLAVARIAAARAAIDRDGGGALLTGRAEGLIRNRPDFDEAIRRLQAYAAAGADCLYVPGITEPEQIARVVQAVAPKPVNLLMGQPNRLKLADFAALGVRRVSVGGSLARAAWGGFMRAARQIADAGSFDGFAEAPSSREIVTGLGG